jgi:hypothetical protein
MIAIFPWEKGEKPYWVNPENGYEWYIDRNVTDYCSKDKSGLPILDAICFYVCNKIEDKINPITRVLIDKKSNNVLADDNSLEGIACKIEMIRMSMKKDW